MNKQKILFGILLFNSLGLSAQENINILNDTTWTYAIKGYPSEIPLIDANNIFVGADASLLVCLDKFTGKEKWKLSERIYRRGFIHSVKDDNEGNIFFNGIRENIYAVKKVNGDALWKYECQFDDDIFSSITISDKVLYVNPAERNFLALSTDGKLLWKSTLPDVCLAYTIEKERIYCQLNNGVYVLNKNNGNVQTKITRDSVLRNRYPFPPVSVNNLLILRFNDSVFCHDKNNKYKLVWALSNINALYYENKSLYTYNDTLFQKVDIETGKILWRLKGNFAWYIQPTVYKSNLYLQTRHKFYIIDNASGEVYFDSPFRFKSYTKPIVEGDKIYFGFGGMYFCTKNPALK